MTKTTGGLFLNNNLCTIFPLMNKGWIIITLCGFGLSLQAQNLVSNPSFEIKSECPVENGKLEKAVGWINPSKATPDLFCHCAQNKLAPVSTPQNGMGYQDPYSGSCYAGLFVYTVNDTLYGEYIQTKLDHPLVKGQTYHVSFWYSLADHSMYKAVSIGIVLTQEKLKKKGNERFHELPSIVNDEPMSNDTLQWQLFHSSYIAKGGEEWLTIGPFGEYRYDEKMRKKIKVPARYKYMIPGEAAYFYIDEVYVSDKPCPFDSTRAVAKTKHSHQHPHKEIVKKDTLRKNEKKNEIVSSNVISETKTEVKKEEPVIFKELVFESGKSVILPASYAELDRMVSLMKTKPEMKIMITGHTDNTGNEKSNLELSRQRAKAVADYLISKGIDSKRINHEGKGSAEPRAENSSEEGKAKNRRVEFILK